MTNKELYQEALSLNLVSSSTEFWTKVRKSGLSPAAWIRIATKDTDEAQCSYCGSRWGNHHEGCLDS